MTFFSSSWRTNDIKKGKKMKKLAWLVFLVVLSVSAKEPLAHWMLDEIKDGKVITDLGKLNPLNNVSEGTVGRVAIRPENFYLQPNPKADSFVIGRTFFGHDALLEVQTPTLRIKARSNGPFAPEIGMPVTVWVRGAVNFYADGASQLT